MATDAAWHERVTASIGGKENYGKGIWPNPYYLQMQCHERRERMRDVIAKLSQKIAMLSEPRFHTGSETAELMESLIAMIGATQILELGTHTGRTTLHFLRAVVGIGGSKVVSVDARPAHDGDFFESHGIGNHFEFIKGWTPETLKQLHGRFFDFVFVDSAHDLAHTQKEVAGLQPIIRPGTMLAFHDVPKWRTPGIRIEPEVRIWLREQIQRGEYDGLILPSPRQLDCIEEYGDPNYPIECSPGLAILIKR